MENDQKILALLSGKNIPRWYAGYRFEKEGRSQFRDCMVFYKDGKAKFERYCYGEAAGLVFEVWVESVALDGTINFKKPFDIAVKPEALPQKFTTMPDDNVIIFDNSPTQWNLAALLKTDKNSGYTKSRVLRLSLLSK